VRSLFIKINAKYFNHSPARKQSAHFPKQDAVFGGYYPGSIRRLAG
jgi:hypothetical protein